MNDQYEEYLQELLEGKDSRTAKSLNKLNGLLKNHYESGETEYSIAHIGRLSKASGGIGEVSIRNQSGKHYQQLIQYWKNRAEDDFQKKPVSELKDVTQKEIELIKDNVSNVLARSYIFSVISERNRLRKEIQNLKNSLKNNYLISLEDSSSTKIKETKVLTPLEVKALKDVLDNNSNFLRKYWTIHENGSVDNEEGEQLFKAGFMNAVKKILENET